MDMADMVDGIGGAVVASVGALVAVIVAASVGVLVVVIVEVVDCSYLIFLKIYSNFCKFTIFFVSELSFLLEK